MSPRTWESAAEVLRRARQTKETHYNETNTKPRDAKRQKAGKKPTSRERTEREHAAPLLTTALASQTRVLRRRARAARE